MGKPEQNRDTHEPRVPADGYRYDSYCGIFCGACDTLIANEQGGVAVLAREWKRTQDELKCRGCKTDVNSVFCRNCEIRRCAQLKRVEFCCECSAYPCERLVAFRNDKHPHHSVVLRNLDEVRSTDSARWLALQRQRWSCPSCGARCSWYDRKCVSCGAALRNCEDEKKTLPPYPGRPA